MTDTDRSCLAHQPVDQSTIDAWVEQFHRQGFLFLKSVLPPDLIGELKSDLERELRKDGKEKGDAVELHTRMFETSRANLRLFDMEPIVTFAETLIASGTEGHAFVGAPSCCHVIHNNSFRTPAGVSKAFATTWHQDDPPHFLVTDGKPPTNVRLPVLLFTCNYYLTDVESMEHGPTQVVPGSHLFGVSCPQVIEGTAQEEKVFSCIGPAGSAVMFNNQVWHRGAPNASDRDRCITQVSYARRIIGHKYSPFMNYVMPEHVYRDASPRLKRLLGFLPGGPYG